MDGKLRLARSSRETALVQDAAGDVKFPFRPVDVLQGVEAGNHAADHGPHLAMAFHVLPVDRRLTEHAAGEGGDQIDLAARPSQPRLAARAEADEIEHRFLRGWLPFLVTR